MTKTSRTTLGFIEGLERGELVEVSLCKGGRGGGSGSVDRGGLGGGRLLSRWRY